jgi:tryptophan halogenase
MNQVGMPHGPIKSIAIAGGGATGWLAAALLARVLRGSCDICVIETDDTGPRQGQIGTLPSLTGLHTILGIDENELLSKTDGTFRLANLFRDWGRVGGEYFHALGETGARLDSIAFHQYWLKLRQSGPIETYSDFNLCAVAARAGKFARPSSDKRSILSTLEYAYHLDAVLYAALLREYACARGVKQDAGKIAGVALSESGNLVDAVMLEDGRRVEADVFIDCTGSKGRIVSALETGFEDWSEWLACDRAIAISGSRGDMLSPYTLSVAHGSGWQWRIPLQNSIGHGFVYASGFMSDDEALSKFLGAVGDNPVGEPQTSRFTNGRRKTIWSGNVIALGAAAATLEPLENLESHIAQIGITRFLALFPDRSFAADEREEYNRLMASELDRMRDFLILHYHATSRNNSPFWNRCREMQVPEMLAHKIRMFQSRARVVLYDEETFSEDSWASVFLGQEIIPRRYDPLADNRDVGQLKTQLQRIRSTVRQGSDSMPSHAAFVRKYCAAPPQSGDPGR